MTTKPIVDIIVLAYNGGTDLAECVASVRAHTALDERTRLLVVDNASTDGSVAALAQRWSELNIITNSTNLGFAAGNNVGMRWALAHGADYVILLNQDLVVNAGWLEPLLETLKPATVGIAQSLILLKNNPSEINAWGCDWHILGFGAVSGYRQRIDASPSLFFNGMDISYAMGAAMAIKRAVLVTAGWFDEATFMYHDDMDLCLRARLLGWRIVLAAASIVRHDYKENMTAQIYYGLEINRLWNPVKFYHLGTLALLFPLWFGFEFFGFGNALYHGWVKAWGQARWYTITRLPHLWRWRRQIQRSRKISDRALFKLARAEFPEVRAVGAGERLVRLWLSYLVVGYWAIARQIMFW